MNAANKNFKAQALGALLEELKNSPEWAEYNKGQRMSALQLRTGMSEVTIRSYLKVINKNID